MGKAVLYTKTPTGLARSVGGWAHDDTPQHLVANITTDAPILDKITYVNAQITMRRDEGAGPVVLDIPAQMKGRGNSTWDAPKKPYKVKLPSGQGATLFGNASSRDWALLANYYDKSRFRTAAVYELGRRATGRWLPHSVFVEVTLNGSYDGLYQFIETTDVQTGRVDIRKMKATDTTGLNVTGPYFLEVDAAGGDPFFTTSRGTSPMYDTPAVVGTAAEAQQSAYISAWFEDFETLLVTGGDWMSKVDVTAWVDYYLLQEVAHNNDSQFYKSNKFYKEQDTADTLGRLVFWPPWDFDLSLAYGWNGDYQNPEEWWTRLGPSAPGSSRPNWHYYATQTPAFIAACRARWDSAWMPALATMPDYIAALGAELAPAFGRDRARWGETADVTFRNDPATIAAWLETRTAWIDTNL